MQLKVIYIDDEADLCELFVENFASDQISVNAFASVNEGVEAIKRNRPDLVVLDYRLPGITGVEVAKQLDPLIPKVLVSGDTDIEAGLGFVRTFQKPFNFEELSAFINSLTTLAP